MARVHRPIDTHTTSSVPSIGHHLIASPTNKPAANLNSLIAVPAPAPRRKLNELSIGQVQNSIAHFKPPIPNQVILKPNCDNFEPKSVSAKHSSRGLRRRAPIDPCIFEPLDAVQEESFVTPVAIDSTSASTADPGASTTIPRPSIKQTSSQADSDEAHPLLTAIPEHPTPKQVERHFAATPLEGNAFSLPFMDISQAIGDQVDMTSTQPPPYEDLEDHEATPLKVPEVAVEIAEIREQAVSPSLTFVSDRSSSYAGGSSRAGSFSVPRIEDSLEEIDKLEEELEAVNAVTRPGRITSHEEAAAPTLPRLELPPDVQKPSISKRSSISGLSSIARIKQIEKAQAPLRRTTSLVFRNKKEESQEAPKLRSQLSRGQLTNSKIPTPKPVKSTKPTTIPNFELPGEAVSRRLKEQREARLAQQADSRQAYVPPPRPKSNKPLTKPNFELPGEAISRRKREERESRLKAQEEEERKKREFKARPARVSVGPTAVPRQTFTSRARQGQLAPEDDSERKVQERKLKRYSLGTLRPSQSESVDPKQSQPRGRLSNAASEENLSRAASASTGSSISKRHTLSSEAFQQLKLKGKQIFERDNTSFIKEREREKREREAAARLAREQAAERSRAASREWAEKKRRREQAMLDSMKQMANPAV